MSYQYYLTMVDQLVRGGQQNNFDIIFYFPGLIYVWKHRITHVLLLILNSGRHVVIKCPGVVDGVLLSSDLDSAYPITLLSIIISVLGNSQVFPADTLLFSSFDRYESSMTKLKNRRSSECVFYCKEKHLSIKISIDNTPIFNSKNKIQPEIGQKPLFNRFSGKKFRNRRSSACVK